MDVAAKIQVKLKKILKRLKALGIIKTFKLEINFHPVKKNLIKSLIEIDSVLKKCLRKIIIRPRRAEIRNVITELVRKKNLNDIIGEEKVIDKNICFMKYMKKDLSAIALICQCGICNNILKSKKSFVPHKKLQRESKIYLCEKCGAIFFTNKKWQEHLKRCNEETELFLSTKYFEYNQTSCQSNKEPLECVKNRSTNLQLSSKNLHTSERGFKNLIQSHNSENHLAKTTHEKKFTCTCGKVFRVWKSLKKHEKLKHSATHTKYDCQQCGKCFIEKGKLNRHMLSHKDSQYRCSVCSKLFTRSDTLKRHLSMCHYISKEFFCNFCQKKFNLKYNRDIHEENIHKNINHCIQCEHCGRKFKNKLTFKGHLETHLKNRIRCTVCSKSFVRKDYYENHVKSKHKHISHQKLLGMVSV